MLRRLVALRHATERIERLESELRDQQAALAAVRSQVEWLVDATARSDRIIADMRQRYAAAALIRTRDPAAAAPPHVVVDGDELASAVPPDALVMVLGGEVTAEPDWVATAAGRLLVDADVDVVIGDRVDVVGGRLVVSWADAAVSAAGQVFRGDVWNRAVAAAGEGVGAGDLARRLFDELAADDRVAVETVVAVVATDA